MFCIAEEFRRSCVEAAILDHYSGEHDKCRDYPESIYLQTCGASSSRPGEVFIIDFGVAVCWNLLPHQEDKLVDRVLKPCSEKLAEQVCAHHFTFHYSATEPPSIANDVITINRWVEK